MIESASRALLLRLGRSARTGRLTIREPGRTHELGPGGHPSATLDIRSPRAWPMLTRGVRGCAEAYCQGLWDSPDIAAVLRVAAQQLSDVGSARRRSSRMRRPFRRLSFDARTTTQARRKELAVHYDGRHELFCAMLDPTMMRSCALFVDSEATLYEAQLRKLDLVCDKLHLGPGDHVLEIGSGWGGFALHAAVTRGCRVTTTTISPKQYRVTAERVDTAGLAGLIDVRLADYRELRSQYDKIVSIEMVEPGSPRDAPVFFECCSRLLAPHGVMLLQAVIVDNHLFNTPRVSHSVFRSYVFPNSCLPCHQLIVDSIDQRTDMRIIQSEDLTAHYPETLRRWRANFDVATLELERLGYGEHVRRLWRLYLADSEAGFEERRTRLIQMIIAKPEYGWGDLGADYIRAGRRTRPAQ